MFSLNAALGPRTVDRGFDYAPVIAADGVLRLGVGGGICQYATTLCNAVFFAGLPVVERHAHSLYIDHYPVGRDATVAWGGPDFRFRNDTGKPLMIRSWTDNGVLTVVIVGKTVGASATRPRPSMTSAHRARARTTLALSTTQSLRGIVKWEPGLAGRSVKVVRTVRHNGAVLFSDTFISATSRRTGSSGSGRGRRREAQTKRRGRVGERRSQVPPAMTCLETSLSVSNTPTPETAQASTTGERCG